MSNYKLPPTKNQTEENAKNWLNQLIKEKDIPATYIDLWRLEVTIKNWYKIIGLKNLIDDKI